MLLSSFFNKGNSCEIENSKNFDAVVEMAYFLNMFLHCKIMISFFRIISGHLFSMYLADPVNKKKCINSNTCQHMTFMMTSFAIK